MAERKQYWSHSADSRDACMLELRSRLAWDLLRHFGSIAAKIDGEDSVGRSKLELQQPEELVHRCFGIADAFVNTAEDRGEVKPAPTEEERNDPHTKTERGTVVRVARRHPGEQPYPRCRRARNVP